MAVNNLLLEDEFPFRIKCPEICSHFWEGAFLFWEGCHVWCRFRDALVSFFGRRGAFSHVGSAPKLAPFLGGGFSFVWEGGQKQEWLWLSKPFWDPILG